MREAAVTNHHEIYGVGIYGVAEAAKLTQVAPARIRRWIRGYTFKGKRGDTRKSSPVWHGQHLAIDGRFALGFLDLIEIRFVDAFLKCGVQWPTIRAAEARARQLFKTDHPFATNQFKTDGRAIFAELGAGQADRAMMDLAKNQFAFSRIISPYLTNLEFADNDAIRWWPLGLKRRVVLDPERSFGQPIVSREGVPTRILSMAFESEQSEQIVSRWYDVDMHSVRDAIEFEKRLAA